MRELVFMTSERWRSQECMPYFPTVTAVKSQHFFKVWLGKMVFTRTKNDNDVIEYRTDLPNLWLITVLV